MTVVEPIYSLASLTFGVPDLVYAFRNAQDKEFGVCVSLFKSGCRIYSIVVDVGYSIVLIINSIKKIVINDPSCI